jgi:OPT family oligopeptide transporter
VRFVSSFVIVRFLPEFHIRCVLALVYTLPFSVIAATTDQYLGLNVITELIIGYALPGRPIAMMLFKTWGYITMVQAVSFTSNFKLAHYMKIAHRPMFFCQVVATIVAGTVQLGVQAWMFSNIEGLCVADQIDGFICPDVAVFGNSSIIVSKLVVLAQTFCIRYSKMLCCSGASLGRDVYFRTVSSTMASSFSSLPVSLHPCSSGYCTRSSE